MQLDGWCVQILWLSTNSRSPKRFEYSTKTLRILADPSTHENNAPKHPKTNVSRKVYTVNTHFRPKSQFLREIESSTRSVGGESGELSSNYNQAILTVGDGKQKMASNVA